MNKLPESALFDVPMTMTRLAMASWETIFHRTMMMAQGACSQDEFMLMANEKSEAMQSSAMALMTGQGHEAMLEPFVTRAHANAKRLREAL